jgi:hypothetical protein
MTRLQSGPHDASGVLHGEPACGIFVGQPEPGTAQAHSGGEMVWQLGYSEPPLHPLHQQRVPSSYQHAGVLPVHVVPELGGGEGQAGGRAGLLHDAALGAVTSHVPSVWQSAVVRHVGRGSSPHEQ